MSLPFFLPYNKLDIGNITSGGGTANIMGKLDYVVFVPLQSANSVASASVTIDTYAWMEDVELSSYTLVPQSDEYGEGVISKPATALADTVAEFKTVPYIGKFATATEIGARAVASIARLFGYTNVPVISDSQPFRSEPFPHLAATDIGYPVEQLTIDSKNELSVHPCAIGLSNEDELSIPHIAARESYITTATWNTTDTEDTLLFSAKVTPLNFYSSTDNPGGMIDMTPTSMLACLFKHWRGDLIYHFDVVASPYHKGRLVISHDPAGVSGINILSTAGTANAVNTHIVDLAETTSFEMRVPYQQPTTYSLTRTGTTSSFLTASACPWATGATPVAFTSQGDSNGYITMRVQTVLTAPVAVAPVNIIVSVRGAGNLEFANPSNTPIYLSTLAPQSHEELDPAHETTPMQLGPSDAGYHSGRNRMHFGETIACLRPYLRRMIYLGNLAYGPSGSTWANGDWIMAMAFHRLPPMFGFDPLGLSTANGVIATASTFPMNYNNLTPLHWVMACFVAYRGSMNYSFDVTANGKLLSNVSVIRDNNLTGNDNITLFSSTSTASISNRAYLNMRRGRNTNGGMTLTNQNTQTGVNVAIPNLSQYRFQTTDAATAHSGSIQDGSNYERCFLEIKEGASINPNDVNIHEYVGAGLDFNLHYFLNVPTWYNYASVPTPV